MYVALLPSPALWKVRGIEHSVSALISTAHCLCEMQPLGGLCVLPINITEDRGATTQNSMPASFYSLFTLAGF